MNKILLWLILFSPGIGLANIHTNGWSAQESADTGNINIYFNTLPILKSQFRFSSKETKWPRKSYFKLKAQHQERQRTQINVPQLGVELLSTTELSDQGNLVWRMNGVAAKPENPSIVGTLEFDLIYDALKSLGFSQVKPIIFNQGCNWKVEIGELVIIWELNPCTYFFRYSSKANNRLILDLFDGNSSDKPIAPTLILTVRPGIKIPSPVRKKLSEYTTQIWESDSFSPASSPIDLSFLNHKPAGKYGFLKTSGDHLKFENGDSIRFWGANLSGNALFKTSKKQIKRHAERLARLGFNLIRIHHHDAPWVKPNLFESAENPSTLNKKNLDLLEWWIYCLKEQGIYIWLDLHVSRELNHIAERYGGKEIKGVPGSKGFVFYNTAVQEELKLFNQELLTHKNPYTGKSLIDDPVLAVVQITNENDLTQHYARNLRSKENTPYHHELLAQDARSFANAHGLNYKDLLKPWKIGYPKMFLSQAEHRFYRAMIQHLRKTGLKIPVVTSNYWGKMSLFSLPGLNDGDIMDAHSYGTAGDLQYDTEYAPGFLSWVANAQIYNKPMSVSEWNVPYPAYDRQSYPFYISTIASFQDWDAPILFGYSQMTLNPLKYKADIEKWSTFNDPAIMGLMPSAALLYRQHQVPVANTHSHLRLTDQDLFFQQINPRTHNSLRTIFEENRVTVGWDEVKLLPWLNATDEPVDKETRRLTFTTSHNTPVSDKPTHKLFSRDPSKGILSINTDFVQVKTGWLENDLHENKDVKFRISASYGTVSVQSLGPSPIRSANVVLVSILGNVQASEGEKLPFQMERVTGEVQIRGSDNMNVFSLSPEGVRIPFDEVKYEEGWYHLILPTDRSVHWIVLEKN